MKRTLLAAALLAAAALPACAPATDPAANSNANRANSNAATPTPAPTVADADHIARERQVADAIKRKDWDAFAAFLADDQIYVSAEGVSDKAATLAVLRKLDLTEINHADSKVVRIDHDLVVVTSTTTAKGTYDGRPIPAGAHRESTAWVNRGGRWLAVYHQETEVMTAPAPTPGAPTPSATAAAATPATAASATPAATPASSTELEQQIWDALKRKDWDGFAALLAADAVEVAPDGVTDKAGSVNGVRQFDFTGVTLSEFRELKIDADATLVTYLVKGPRAPFDKGSRHTTIHANRSGRWLAIFHQGTPIK